MIGNPRPDSRTRTAAVRAARRAAGAAGLPDDVGVVELAHLRRGLLDDTPPPAVSEALEHVRSARLLVVASPTYKATYTGLLKAFLDLLPGGGLAGVTAVPLLVMASPAHALAVEVHLRPLLLELGAHAAVPGLAVPQDAVPQANGPEAEDFEPLDDLLTAWTARAAPALRAAGALGARTA
ncbi:NAD(P)H-dependent oxidoreductase [Streptomonospora nanhaiensis]|uniref:NAD(P)H-dependent oxidoreductase n=1 Tax=Streptomonospora nanhaiensis TaxID=1323731 RepID=UPI001C549B28|nr:NAD(P)H-dependent oxidoreductase [Streptomonospora nanhaiensis]